jgi:GNAT superfamily N-acetyltransferase
VTPPVRLAAVEDAPVVARLLCDFRDHEGRHWPPHHLMLRGVERLIGRDDGEFLLGGDPPAGIVQLRYRYGVWWDALDCCVEDVFVREEARGTGLGRALVAFAIERARERGCRRLELEHRRGQRAGPGPLPLAGLPLPRRVHAPPDRRENPARLGLVSGSAAPTRRS